MLIFRVVGIGLLVVGALASIVIFLFPLGILSDRAIFLQQPETSLKSLWLLFALCLTFGGALFALGLGRRPLWSYAKIGGSGLLVLGLASAIEILWIKARVPKDGGIASLWWLFVICTVLGGIIVYVAEVVKRIEAVKREEEAKKMERQAEESCRACGQAGVREWERGVYRFNVRR